VSPRAPSPLNDPVWRLALVAAIAVAAWVAAVPAVFAWFTAVRLLLLDSRAGRFWVIWLVVLSAPVLLWATSAAAVGAVGAAAVFLIFRRYRPYRHLTSRRSAGLFFIGLAAFGLSIALRAPGAGEGASYWSRLGPAVLSSATGALRVYWFMTVLHLVLGMRLHFLRLRPKLLMSALFVAVVPLLLFLALGVTTLLGVLGATRATSGRRLLLEWSDRASRVAGVAAADSVFAAHEGDPVPASAPAWLPDLWRSLHAVPAPPESLAAAGERDATAEVDSIVAFGRRRPGGRGTNFTIGGGDSDIDTRFGRRWAPKDTTLLFHRQDEIWVLRLQRERRAGPGAPGDTTAWAAAGRRVSEATLRDLARLLDADVGIYSSRHLAFGTSDSPESRAARADSTRGTLNLLGRLPRQGARPDSTAGLWRRPLNLGAAVLGMVRSTPRGLVHDAALLHVRLAPADVWHELASGDNEFNRVVLIGLLSVAVLLLLFVAFTVLLGVRIATGITSAVGELQRGTVRLAEGDLDTRIEVPNEDEFGDLAGAFNDMAVAVKRGREEAVERERLDRELRMAREIQDRLLPHEMPEVPGFEVTGTSVPSLQVGGDYFDFLDLGDGKLGVAIGDVSGKGVPAALLMANLQALLQGQVIHPSGVAEIVARINDLLARSIDPSRFASFFYGVLDRNAATFTCTNAGHNPPLLLRADGPIEQLTVGGLLLGMLPSMPYQQQTVTLGPGDVLVMYTDGITEAVGPPPARAAEAGAAAGPAGRERGAGEPQAPAGAQPAVAVADDEEPLNLFGDERLLEVLRANGKRTAGEVREAILSAVREHAAGIPPSDDITLVVIRRRP
jgi:serine phosphatase RsbU (regulator of sigma subunit)